MLIASEPKIIVLSLLAFFVILFIIAQMLPFSKRPVALLTGKKEVTVIAEIADNPIKQARGLMFREDLGENEGMLFVFGGDEPRSFWMKNTLIPLDLIFISSSNVIVDIKENFEPCETFYCERYISKPAAYVLEVNAGFVKRHGINVDDRIRLG